MVDTDHSEFSPTKIDDFVIEIGGLIIPLRLIGHINSADEIVGQWKLLDDEGFPMRHLSSLFVAIDYIEKPKHSIIYFLPDILHLIRLVDAIAYCKSIRNANSRINILRDEFKSLIKTALQKTEKQPYIALEIIRKIVAYADEFQIGCIMHRLYSNLVFTSGQGPDFKIDDIGIKVEAKSKLNKSYLGSLVDPSISLDESTCMKLLSRDAYQSGILVNAFDDQNADIAVINLSHSQYGVLFAMYAYGINNKTFEVGTAINEALTNAKMHNKDMAVLYCEQVSPHQPYSICAVTIDRDQIEKYGFTLYKLEKEYNIDTSNVIGYNRLIEEAKRMVV
jgi:hypothetical protein